MNLYQALSEKFSQAGDRVALRMPETGLKWTFNDLAERAAQYASLLTEQGLEPGDRVAVQVEKGAEALAIYLGVLQSGGTYLPMNTAYTKSELKYFVENAEPAFVVCSSKQVETFSEINQQVTAGFKLYTLDEDSVGSICDAADSMPKVFTTVERGENDLAAILYTSGTTGRPKGAMISHSNLLSNGRVLLDYWGWKEGDVLLHALPIFHVHGLFVACSCALLNASEMIFYSKFDANKVLEELPNATVMMGVPTFYTRLLAEKGFTKELAANVRLFISGSAPLLEETFEEFEQRTGKAILERYGMTETGMNTSNPLDGKRIAGTVGFPLPGTEVRIMDGDNNPLAAGEVGSLQVKGPNVFQGYWRMPEKTAEEFTDDGFFITGDLGKIDDQGYVSIVGRSKDLIISGGYNIYPKEVEMVLNDIEHIDESAVFAFEHPDFGEGVAAAIVKTDLMVDVRDEQIIEICKGNLAGFKVPRRIVYLAELPRNTMGKVQKNVLRDLYGQKGYQS
ncbi:AMP-binding protein [Neptuniibacter sp.]|uniref:AMP-binding protein n=1 Tax=Neptuniibacter sp. TaxID=1962643 RepID=UPI00261E3300|nr:AMP-binding protein [Neptuniibacter sp.]MCP4596374.1 AMP-binding protein [Neptuniibacter sp.]